VQQWSKRLLSVIAALALAVSVASACANGNAGDEPKASGGQEKQGDTGDKTDGLPMANGKFEPPVTLTAVRHIGGGITFKEGETMEDNVHTRWAKEKLGIDIKYLWTASGPEDTFTTKLNLALSAGEELPDVIPFAGGMRTNLMPLLESGKFADARALFDQYAGPAMRAAYDEAPEAWYPYTIDGQAVAIPILDQQFNSNLLLWVRTDWLKKLGLKAPTTIDEMEAVMDAFVNRDPDGNGKKDTYGLTAGFKNAFHTWMSDIGFVFAAYGDMPDIWNKDENGNLTFGSVAPTIKEGLAKLRSWKEKGYLHPESAIWDETKATELWGSGHAGMIVAPRWAPAWPLQDVVNNVEGAEYEPAFIPAGPTGLAGTRKNPAEYGGILINKDMKHPEVLFTYLNYLYENYTNPPKGGEFEYGFAEGYDYTMVEGKPVWDRDKIPGGYVEAIKYSLNLDGGYIPSLMIKTMDKLNKGGTPETPFEVKAAYSNSPLLLKASSMVLEQAEAQRENFFLGSSTPTMREKGAALGTMLHEGYTKIIYGELPLEEFDKLVADWKKSGGDQITQEVNEWYHSVAK